MNKKRLEILDCTLREGMQSEGISFSLQDKLKIVRTLDLFGVDYIEAGHAGSNPKDDEFFTSLSQLGLKKSKVVAFGSTCRKGMLPANDEMVLALDKAATKYVSVFGKADKNQVTEIIKTDAAENLRMISETISFFTSKGKHVFFDAEHFFDGYMDNRDYALSVLKAAINAGASRLVLCDTKGGMLPETVFSVTKEVKEIFPDIKLGIHCHNDAGCADANTVISVSQGISHVQGTFLGVGERCGNADLSTVVPNLVLKMGYSTSCDVSSLYTATRKIAETLNKRVPGNAPFVGKSAFAHKGGIHVDGMMKLESSYEHIDPESVGNKRRILISEVSGKSTLLSKIRSFTATEVDMQTAEALLTKLKDMEHYGYHFESADASLELFVLRELGMGEENFTLLGYKAESEYPVCTGMPSSAEVSIEAGGIVYKGSARGNGPVNALDSALTLALIDVYPELGNIMLTDYKVRVIEGTSTTAAKIRVLIDSTDGENTWSTVGVSTDIIEASMIALSDSAEYMLSHIRKKRER